MNTTREVRLLRVAEAAERLAIEQSTLRAWIYRRRLPFVRVGDRAIRIRADVIQDLIERGNVPAR